MRKNMGGIKARLWRLGITLLLLVAACKPTPGSQAPARLLTGTPGTTPENVLGNEQAVTRTPAEAGAEPAASAAPAAAGGKESTGSGGDNPTPTPSEPALASSPPASPLPPLLLKAGASDQAIRAVTPPQAEDGWPMAGGNPQRTSWTSEEVSGDLKPVWFKHFDAYISQKVQIIATNNTLYLSTAQGLFALDAASGSQRWFFPTALPLGHSPTVVNDSLYVGGFDRRLYALDARTGQEKWHFTAGAGFETNPLVIEGKVFAGNRDGFFYALNAGDGSLAWKFPTGGAVLYSAAYQDGTVYFASNDNYAYALRARDGGLVWKSAQLPGHGFHSWWPVVYGGYVVFSGSYNFRYTEPYPGPHTILETQEAFPAGSSKGDFIGPKGAEGGDWIKGTVTVNDSAAAQYFENHPDRRTYMVLNRYDGREYTFDSDGDGRPEYAPILWFGTHSGTRFPPAVGPDDVIYQANALQYDPQIPRGWISGWKIGTPYVSVPKASGTAVDEPLAYAIGGNTIYWKLCCDRVAAAVQITAKSGTAADLQSWNYFDGGGKILRRYLPELYNEGWDYAYWKHGDQSPPVPYKGKVYVIANNAIVAYGADGHGQVLTGDLNTGKLTGEATSEVMRGQTFPGSNLQVTAGSSAWPLIVSQESYYNIDSNPTAQARWLRLVEVAGDFSSPSSLNVSQGGAVAQLTSSFSSGSLQSWVSQRSPGVLFNSTSSTYRLTASLAGLAFLAPDGPQVLTSPAAFDGSRLAAGWLLAWDSTANHRWMPFLVSLEHRPAQVSFSSQGLQLSFPGPAGYLAVTPLYGMSAPRSPEEQTWLQALPQASLDRIASLDRLARAFPVAAQESWSLQGQDAVFSLQDSYAEFPGEWGATPLRLAYLPPTLALAAWEGSGDPSPITVNGQSPRSLLDLDYLTPLGRVAGLPDQSQAEVRLPGVARLWQESFLTQGSYRGGDGLNAELVEQVQAILRAGHLRPGYGVVGIWESRADHRLGDHLGDYWHNPADTVYTLAGALPFLPGDMQEQVKAYLQREFQSYPLYRTAHVGWKDGASRDAFQLPKEVQAEAATLGPRQKIEFNDWDLPPFNLYALAQYAELFGNPGQHFNEAQGKLPSTLDFTASFPYVLNSYIAGYLGYLRLAYLSNAGPQPQAQATLFDLLTRRAALSKYPAALQPSAFEYAGYAWTLRRIAPDQPDTLFNATVDGSLWSQMPLYGFPIDGVYGLSGASSGGDYAFAIDFVNLTPPTAAFLRTFAPAGARATLDSYTARAPYWFVAEAEETGGEGVFQPLYDRWAFFQAKALVAQAGREDLEPFLDVPAVQVGDLYFIQNLAATLQAK